jgi:hypothetical protein
MAWTEGEDGEVRAGIAAGLATAEIAKRLPGRTLGAVRVRRSALREGACRVMERWTEAENEQVRAGVAASETTAEIAERVPGRTQDAVEHRRATLKLGRRVELWTETEDGLLRADFASGKTWREIAKRRTMQAEAARGINRLGLKRHEEDASGMWTLWCLWPSRVERLKDSWDRCLRCWSEQLPHKRDQARASGRVEVQRGYGHSACSGQT